MQIQATMKAEATKAAERLGLTLSAWVRVAIREKLDRDKKDGAKTQ